MLARLHLTGNFIWGPAEEPRLYLDGDGFGVLERVRAGASGAPPDFVFADEAPGGRLQALD